MHSGQTAPVASGKLESLVALIDEILATRAQGSASEKLHQQPE
jgi:hypothetical protein